MRRFKERMIDAWLDAGGVVDRVPAQVALGVALVLVVLVYVAGGPGSPIGIGCAVVWVTFCLLRGSGRWELFVLPAMPKLLAEIGDSVHDGAYWYVWVAAVPLAIACAADDAPGETRTAPAPRTVENAE